jgi:RsmE family RNA methyltransferase
MNILLFAAGEVASDGSVEIVGQRADALISAHELKSGLCIKGGAPGAGRGLAHIDEVRPGLLRARLLECAPALLREPFVLVVAVPRPQAVKRILFHAAMFGIEAVHFIRSERVDKNYLKSQIFEGPQMQAELVHGAAQAGDSELPKVHVHEKFLGFMRDYLPQSLQQKQGTIFLADTHPDTTVMAKAVACGSERHVLAIGPELGWNDFERGCWLEAGAKPVSLGPRILRVDAAFTSLFWQIKAISG